MVTKGDVFLNGGAWASPGSVVRWTYDCGYCNHRVASDRGWFGQKPSHGGSEGICTIRICPSCDGPTLFTFSKKQYPGSLPGAPVLSVPHDLASLYDEARCAAAAGAPTAAVLACRKLLMNIAVAEGAPPNSSFLSYVEFLDGKGFVPPKGKGWVDYIRKRGNEANHEIELMKDEDAKSLILFIEMLLKFIYEFPSLIPKSTAAP